MTHSLLRLGGFNPVFTCFYGFRFHQIGSNSIIYNLQQGSEGSTPNFTFRSSPVLSQCFHSHHNFHRPLPSFVSIPIVGHLTSAPRDRKMAKGNLQRDSYEV